MLVTFGNLFCELAEEGHLDVLNEVDMFCLHTVFLPRINKSLSEFAASWNNHAISTEGMQTPLQLFYTGQIEVSDNSSSDESDSNADSDSDAAIASHDPVPVPRCSFQPCQQLMRLMSTVDPLMQRSDQGKGLYIEATNVVGQHLTTGCQVCALCDS